MRARLVGFVWLGATLGCGGNVVVDHGAGGQGGTSATSTTTAGEGLGTTTSAASGAAHQICATEETDVGLHTCVAHGHCRGHVFRSECSHGHDQFCSCFEDDARVGSCSETDDSCGNCCTQFFH
jgi:hypothetical protein